MNLRQRRSQQHRGRTGVSPGLLAGLLTAASVILLGVLMQHEPYVILVRSSASALLLGCLVSLGVSIVRLADSEYRNDSEYRKEQRPLRGRPYER